MSASELSEAEALATPQYWDKRYAEVGANAQVHEWFKNFGELENCLDQNLFQLYGPQTEPNIIHLGSGDSTVPLDLAARGYQHQLCVDFSSVVVETMRQKHAHADGIVWKQLDIRHMDVVASGSIDVAFDKGTLDAMVHGSPWSPPQDVLDNTSHYVNEVFRILKSSGTFLYITYRQPHFVRPLLDCKGTAWTMEVKILGDAGSFDYYGFVLKKKHS